MDKQKYSHFCDQETGMPLFSRPWWLDAVCGPENWDVVLVEKGNEVVGALPYYQTVEKGFRLLSMPALTQVLGPWLRYPDGQKYETRLSWEKKLYSELARKLPRYDYFSQRFNCSVTNWLPFYWLGFRQTTRYTYRLDLSDTDSLWGNLKENIRREIKKAQKEVTINGIDDIDTFYEINKKTFSRQDRKIPYNRELITRLDQACSHQDCRLMLVARDKHGNVHAGLYLVWDNNCAYYLMGGADPDYRNDGSASLLLWHAIQQASQITGTFDFEGSMLEPVERFFRSFGARQIPYYHVSRANSILIKLYQATRYLASPQQSAF